MNLFRAFNAKNIYIWKKKRPEEQNIFPPWLQYSQKRSVADLITTSDCQRNGKLWSRLPFIKCLLVLILLPSNWAAIGQVFCLYEDLAWFEGITFSRFQHAVLCLFDFLQKKVNHWKR